MLSYISRKLEFCIDLPIDWRVAIETSVPTKLEDEMVEKLKQSSPNGITAELVMSLWELARLVRMVVGLFEASPL